MFCPSCGLENAQSQKFCRRCGTNLLALQAASEMLTDMTTGHSTHQLDPKFILKLVTFLGSFGFFIITAGAIGLTVIQLTANPDARHDAPLGLFLGVFGYAGIILISWLMMRFARQSNSQPAPMVFGKAPAPNVLPNAMASPALPPASVPVSVVDTNPQLGAASGYQSVIEDETKQFAHQPRQS